MSEKQEEQKFTPISDFGRDHWSCLLFIEDLCVNSRGVMTDKLRRHVRTNIKTHPLLGYWPTGPMEWKSTYDTRAKHGQIPNHDDWDCIDDMEEAGLLENVGTGVNPIYRMQPLGSRLAAALRAWRAMGNGCASFDPIEYDRANSSDTRRIRNSGCA